MYIILVGVGGRWQLDKEHPLVTVVVHLYDPGLAACRVLNEHLAVMAQMWRDVKFLAMEVPDTLLV